MTGLNKHAFHPIIKYTGSKRYLSDIITKLIPFDISRFVDPFVGGGSLLPFVYEHNNIRKFLLSDNLDVLIALWQYLQNNSDKLIDEYRIHWLNLSRLRPDYYYQIRNDFNAINFPSYHNPSYFFFLLRTSYNGLVRFSRSGEYNVSYHHTRKGMHPSRIKNIVTAWHDILNVCQFKCQDYQDTLDVTTTNDFVFLDPPYSDSKGLYGTFEFDYERLWFNIDRLNQMNIKWLLTLDSNHKDSIVPQELYCNSFLGINVTSRFRYLKKTDGDKNIKERFYTNIENDEYVQSLEMV
jgi:DNA adenine methylase